MPTTSTVPDPAAKPLMVDVSTSTDDDDVSVTLSENGDFSLQENGDLPSPEDNESDASDYFNSSMYRMLRRFEEGERAEEFLNETLEKSCRIQTYVWDRLSTFNANVQEFAKMNPHLTEDIIYHLSRMFMHEKTEHERIRSAYDSYVEREKEWIKKKQIKDEETANVTLLFEDLKSKLQDAENALRQMGDKKEE